MQRSIKNKIILLLIILTDLPEIPHIFNEGRSGGILKIKFLDFCKGGMTDNVNGNKQRNIGNFIFIIKPDKQ